jgi:3-oxoacyl-[acyl-carrier protein] reductase
MDLGLKGKVAIVAASSKGMGRATAMGLAAEGARVTMLARGEAELLRAAEEIRGRCQAEVLAVPADVTRPRTSRGWFRKQWDAGGVWTSW